MRRPTLTRKRLAGLQALARHAEAVIQEAGDGDGDLVRGGRVLRDVEAGLDYIQKLRDWFVEQATSNTGEPK